MYTKEELENMAIPQLMEIAAKLGVKVSQNDSLETVVYDILDKAAIESASIESSSSKRKRTRIAKKESENDSSEAVVVTDNKKKKDKAKVKDIVSPSLFDEKQISLEDGQNAPQEEKEDKSETKKRVRKVKAESEDKKEAEDNQEKKAKAKKTKTQVKDSSEKIIENDSESKAELEPLAQQNPDETNQEELATSNSDFPEFASRENNESFMSLMVDEDYWAEDPADGTDFITVVDLPIEDQAAIPTLDMFDRPMAIQQEPVYPSQENQTVTKNGSYDFEDMIHGNGVLELLQDGYGFLRSSDYNYLSSPDDIYVSQQQIKKYSLKTGDVVECTVRPPHENEKYFALSSVISINGREPSEVRDRVSFEHLTPLFPDVKFNLCGDPNTTNPSTRIVDLFSPIGKGQRALIVAQPKTGKTILMKDIANAIAANHPEAYIMMLLIDERPEEVTDMSRTVRAEVIASTFDEPADRHVKIAGIVLEKAKRMVECGHDVVIFLDSITRLARAYNTVSPASGKVLTGGVDANALQKPKRFFGAARNIEGGGSLTIIATALVDTGSKMDEVIFEEFKGTGNSEIQLDRMLSNKRVFPSVNLVQSSTRRDDLLQDHTTLNRMWIIRKFIAEMNPIEAMNTVRDRLMQSRNNEEFLMSMNG